MESKTKQELDLVKFMSKCDGKALKQSKVRFYKRLQQRKYSRQWETHKVDELSKLKRTSSPSRLDKF